MKIIWDFGWNVYKYITTPSEHKWPVYMYNQDDQSIYSFNWHRVTNDVLLGIKKLLYSNTIEVWKELHALSECTRCWWKWYIKKPKTVRVWWYSMLQVEYPMPCSCHFAIRLQSEVDLFYKDKDTGKYNNDDMYTAYVLVVYLT